MLLKFNYNTYKGKLNKMIFFSLSPTSNSCLTKLPHYRFSQIYIFMDSIMLSASVEPWECQNLTIPLSDNSQHTK